MEGEEGMNKLKRILAMMLAVIMSVTVLPQSVTSVHAATGYASLAYSERGSGYSEINTH